MFKRTKETYYSVKRDLLQRQEDGDVQEDSLGDVQEDKRDLLQCQKRPTTASRRWRCSRGLIKSLIV